MKVPPPRFEGATSSPRRCRLRQSRVPRFAHGVSELAKTVSKLAKSYVESLLTIAGMKFFCTFAITFFRYHLGETRILIKAILKGVGFGKDCFDTCHAGGEFKSHRQAERSGPAA